MKKKLFVFVVAVLLVSISQRSFAMTNDEIADTALKYVGQYAKQCKGFVQDVITELGGSLGGGYRGCYSPEKNEIRESDALKGDIIQLSDDVNPENTDNVHTAIVLENLGDGKFKVVHSNWCLDNCRIVSVNIINPSRFAKYCSGGTMLYPNYSAHFYRLGIVNQLSFHFPNSSSQGWQCENTTEFLSGKYGDMIGFSTTGINSKLESPSYSCGLKASDFVVLAKAGIAGFGEINGAKAYLYDQLGSWDNQVNLSPVDISDLSIKKWFDQESGTTNETCFQANAGFVCLSERNFQFLKADFADVARPSIEVKKFSLELSNRTGDFQFLDDVIICSKARSWDFEDSQLGWTIAKEARNCDHPFYPEDATAPTHYWRMEATGGYSTIESPFLYSSDSADTMIGIRYSVRPKKLQDQPVVLQKLPDAHVVFIYDNGNGYNKDAQVSHKLIPRNGETQNVVLDIPPEFQGKIVRLNSCGVPLCFKYSDL